MNIASRGKLSTRRWAAGAVAVLAAVLSLSSPASAQAAAATGSISGTLTTATGAPLPGVTVGVYKVNDWLGRFATTTDSAGHYQVSGLPTGTYRVGFWVQRSSSSMWEQWAHQVTRESQAKRFTVTAGSALVVDETRFPTGGLALSLLDSAGQPVGDFCGEVVGDNFVESGCTEAGTLTLGDLPAGDYTVALWGTSDPGAGGFEFASVTAEQLTPVTVLTF